MSEPSDRKTLLFTVLYAAWVIVCAWSFVAYMRAPYEGAGFPDGLNKPAVFLGWQGIAAMLALTIWGVSLGFEKGSGARSLGRVPLIFSFLVFAGLLALIWRAGGV
jgi:hypothetical protein